MKITVSVSRAELVAMHINAGELQEHLYEQLDDAVLPSGLPSIPLEGYEIEVIEAD